MKLRPMRKIHLQASLAAGLLAALLAAISPAQAARVAFSDFGPNGSFVTDNGWCAQGPAAAYAPDGKHCGSPVEGGGITQLVASFFVPGVSGTLQHINIAVSVASGLTGLSVCLVGDFNGAPSEKIILEEWLIPKSLPPFTTTYKPTTLTSKAHPALSAGEKYWLVVTPTGYDGADVWAWNNIGAPGASVSQDGGKTWIPEDFGGAGAFAVFVN